MDSLGTYFGNLSLMICCIVVLVLVLTSPIFSSFGSFVRRHGILAFAFIQAVVAFDFNTMKLWIHSSGYVKPMKRKQKNQIPQKLLLLLPPLFQIRFQIKKIRLINGGYPKIKTTATKNNAKNLKVPTIPLLNNDIFHELSPPPLISHSSSQLLPLHSTEAKYDSSNNLTDAEFSREEFR